MKKALLALVFSGLMAVGAASCGGGGSSDSDIISQLCNKAASCSGNATDSQVQECKSEGNKAMSGLTAQQKSQATDILKTCLNKDCAAFESCIESFE